MAFLRPVVMQVTAVRTVDQPVQPIRFPAIHGVGGDGRGVEVKEGRGIGGGEDFHTWGPVALD